MSLFDLLSGAVDNAGSSLVADVESIGQTILSGMTFEIKTNLGPAFILGGQYHAPSPTGIPSPDPPNPGLLDMLGIQVGGKILDASGKTIFTYADEPPTSIPYACAALLLMGSLAFLVYRGVRSFYR